MVIPMRVESEEAHESDKETKLSGAWLALNGACNS